MPCPGWDHLPVRPWWSWIRQGGQWRRVSGPHPTIPAARDALTRWLLARELSVASQDQAITHGDCPSLPSVPREVQVGKLPT
jgi:hypothetical protein